MSTVKDEPKLRHVAVLLTSVDTATARHLLGQFPSEQGKKIRRAMAQLGNVTAEERRRVLVEFRQQTAKGKPSPIESKQPALSPAAAALQTWPVSGDLLDISDSARASQSSVSQRTDTDVHFAAHGDQSSNGMMSQSAPADKYPHWQNLPAAELADLLTCERPTVIAVVINQVSPQHATMLLATLPRQLASEALAAVPLLQTIDGDILADIHKHLQQQLKDYFSPKIAFTQGVNRLRAILTALPMNQREEWAKSLVACQPKLAPHLNEYILSDSANEKTDAAGISSQPMHSGKSLPASEMSAVVSFGNNVDSDPQLTQLYVQINETPHADAKSGTDGDLESPIIHSFADAQKAQLATENVQLPFEQLTAFSAGDLATVLKRADPGIVLLALSGASDAMYAKILNLMNSRDAKRVEARLSQLSSIQLQDVDLAQKRIAQIATQLLATGEIGSSRSLSAAA